MGEAAVAAPMAVVVEASTAEAPTAVDTLADTTAADTPVGTMAAETLADTVGPQALPEECAAAQDTAAVRRNRIPGHGKATLLVTARPAGTDSQDRLGMQEDQPLRAWLDGQQLATLLDVQQLATWRLTRPLPMEIGIPFRLLTTARPLLTVLPDQRLPRIRASLPLPRSLMRA